MRILLFFLGFFLFIGSSFAFDFCGISVDDPYLKIIDSSGDPLFWIDEEGDFALKSQVVSTDLAVSSENNNFVVDSGSEICVFDFLGFCFNKDLQVLFFGKGISNYLGFFGGVNDFISAGKGVEIQNSSGDTVAILSGDRNMYFRGLVGIDGEQAGCPADGWSTCNQKIAENRNYSCNSATEDCDSVVVDTYDCSLNDGALYCNGNDVYERKYGCGAGACDDNTVPDVYNKTCGQYTYCNSGACKSYQWKTGNWYGCTARATWNGWSSCDATPSWGSCTYTSTSCGSWSGANAQGSRTRTCRDSGYKTCNGESGTESRTCNSDRGTEYRDVWCERQDGTVVDDSLCDISLKPSIDQRCTDNSCSGSSTRSCTKSCSGSSSCSRTWTDWSR